MPSEVVSDTTVVVVTPQPCKGALGTWRAWTSAQTQSWGFLSPSCCVEARNSKPVAGGVYMCQPLSFLAGGKAASG